MDPYDIKEINKNNNIIKLFIGNCNTVNYIYYYSVKYLNDKNTLIYLKYIIKDICNNINNDYWLPYEIWMLIYKSFKNIIHIDRINYKVLYRNYKPDRIGIYTNPFIGWCSSDLLIPINNKFVNPTSSSKWICYANDISKLSLNLDLIDKPLLDNKYYLSNKNINNKYYLIDNKYLIDDKNYLNNKSYKSKKYKDKKYKKTYKQKNTKKKLFMLRKHKINEEIDYNPPYYCIIDDMNNSNLKD